MTIRNGLSLLLLLAPAVLVAQGVASGDARPISLEEAVRLAQRNSPQTMQARGAISTGEAAVRSAWGAYIPSLSVNTGASLQGGEQFFQGQLVPYRGQPWSYSRGVSTSLELFDGMRRINTLRSARANVDAAESNERLQLFAVALSVKQQYYDVLAARESRTAALAQLAQADEQLKAASARVAAGAATKSDSLRSVIQVGNGRLAVLTAENNLRVANASLTRLVGTPFTVTAEAEEGAEIPSVRLDSTALQRWISEAPAVIQAQASVDAARASYRASRSPYLPTISVSYNMNGSNTMPAFGSLYAYQNTTRFSLSYPIFNGFQREESVNRASVSETVAQASLRDARLLAQQQLTQNVGSLELAQERVAIQLASVAAADEDLRVQTQRYSLGSSTLLDVLTSQLTLNQARSALIQARYDARVAKAQIEALVGRDIH